MKEEFLIVQPRCNLWLILNPLVRPGVTFPSLVFLRTTESTLVKLISLSLFLFYFHHQPRVGPVDTKGRERRGIESYSSKLELVVSPRCDCLYTFFVTVRRK